MLPRLPQVLVGSLVAAIAVFSAAGVGAARADDGGLLSRLFRLGGGSWASNSSSPAPGPNQSAALPVDRNTTSAGGALPMGPASAVSQPVLPDDGGLPRTPSTLPAPGSVPGQRLTPKPRVSSALTYADPLLTRFALGRSSDGSSFGMFTQVFSDGIVIDSEGVHRLRQADLKALTAAVQSSDLLRQKGHCGAPAADFIEYVHITIYERRMGRLLAHTFSYSGNPQGCDRAIAHLHAVLENLQAKLSRQPVSAPSGPAGAPLPLGASPIVAPGSLNPKPSGPATVGDSYPTRQPTPPAISPGGVPSGPVIPLTPIDEPR